MVALGLAYIQEQVVKASPTCIVKVIEKLLKSITVEVALVAEFWRSQIPPE
jgi:hypothetical protein